MKACVLLSGCGVFDGSEVQESVLTLLSLDEHSVAYDAFSLAKDQTEVVSHSNQAAQSDQVRNCLEESARITRGEVKPVSEIDVDSYAFLVIPGGFGVAKNFCDFAYKGAELSVNEDIETVLNAFYKAKKPIVCLCIAPVLLAKIFPGCTVTLGQSSEMTEVVAALNAKAVLCESQDIVYDESFQFITSPAYMNEASISGVKDGVQKAIKKAVSLTAVTA